MKIIEFKSVSCLREQIRGFVEHPRFDQTIIALILLNAITLGLETSTTLLIRFGAFFHIVETLVLVVFVVELLLRFFVYRSRFFQDPWRIFDFVIVGISIIPSSSMFTILRALRILRMLRLISMIPSMRNVVNALFMSLPGIGSIIGLMALVVYIAAVMATNLFGAIAPEFFGEITISLFTLFQVMTVEDWPAIARDVMAKSPYAWIFFVSYLLIATFMVLNLFIAVVVNAMQAQIAVELKGSEKAHTNLILDEIRALRCELEAIRENYKLSGIDEKNIKTYGNANN